MSSAAEQTARQTGARRSRHAGFSFEPKQLMCTTARTALVAVGLASLFAGSVAAQTAEQNSAFARDRNIAVTDRPHPEYAPLDLRGPGFTLKPELDIGLIYLDNVFATPSSPKADTDIHISPSLTLLSDWSRNEFGAYVTGQYDQFLTYHSENAPQVDIGTHYRLDTLVNSSATLAAEFQDSVEPRTAANVPQGLAAPERFQSYQLNFNNVTELNRFRYIINGNLSALRYQDPRLNSGGLLDVSTSDSNLFGGDGEVEYALNPGTAVYLYAGVNDHKFLHNRAGANLDSGGFDVAIGTNFDITSLARGDLRIGYLRQSYSADIPPVGGLDLNASITYFPSQITTVKASIIRAIEYTDALAAASYLRLGGSFEIDHELYRNVILSAFASSAHDTYNGVCGCVFDRKDTLWTGGVGATYLVNRRVGLNAKYTHQNLTSTGLNGRPGYQTDLFQLGTVLHY